ncbi:TPA: hypothetical protein SH447_004536 [Salmonella enterica]|jgi:hypothetical protein|nr:hypothetical protein [Enterococcus faecium]ELG7156351.1 hypothetical protein [Staphylococcus aureus]MDN3040512.1 hypothetical protein [Enterococcus faecium]HDH7443096.1 hypothetical protein [Escherichia coli]HEH8886020.1 hypothetical protein [Salmonella enterica]
MDNRSTYNQHGQLIVIDGTAEDGTYQGDGTAAPFALFNVAEQRNIEGPFDTMAEARAALARHNPLYAQAVSRARQVENSVRFWGAQYAEHGDESAARSYRQSLFYGIGALETLDVLGLADNEARTLMQQWEQRAADLIRKRS